MTLLYSYSPRIEQGLVPFPFTYESTDVSELLTLPTQLLLELVSVRLYIITGLVIQTLYPPALNVLYNKDVYPTSSIV